MPLIYGYFKYTTIFPIKNPIFFFFLSNGRQNLSKTIRLISLNLKRENKYFLREIIPTISYITYNFFTSSGTGQKKCIRVNYFYFFTSGYYLLKINK